MVVNDTGLPDDVLAEIDEELARRFEPHADDPLYAEIRRVRRKELIELAQREQAAGA